MTLERTETKRICLTDIFKHDGDELLRLSWDSNKPGAVEMELAGGEVSFPTLTKSIEVEDLNRLSAFVDGFKAELIKEMDAMGPDGEEP